MIRLRQAHSTGATTTTIPTTSVALDFLQILQTLGFIDQIQSGSSLEAVHVTLTSTGDRSVLEAIERLSLLQAETDLEHSPDLMDWITHLRNPDPAIREKAVSLLGVSYGESNP
uniref:30S ribosomal protein S8 n=1 Tax=Oscillatoria sp. FACHB-1407 TaxID=2692847 RepID=UPI00210650E3|nr:30S ribosomal protein S8 [Oscillatoria sp. FACHB-1407]